MKLNKLLRHTAVGTALIVVILALIACGSDDDKGDTEELTQTSVQFSWLHTMEFAGFYEAVDKGYYAEENLEVRLDEGGFDENGNYIPPVVRVMGGEADFGVAGADVLLQARAVGDPVVGIAAIYQRSPVILVSLAEKNIRTPKDLIGKNIGHDGEGTATYIVYRAFMESEGISPSDVVESQQPYTLDNLINGEIDVRTGFINNQPLTLKSMEHDVYLIVPSDYGIGFYNNVIFTTEDTIANKPDLVEKFLRATLRGFDDAIADPKHAAEVSATYSEWTVEQELDALQASLPLLRPAGQRTGMMEASVWEKTHETLLNQGVLTSPTDYEATYTLTFIEKIYSE
jgi:NitT/TauT family transport system substrate-binding protein